MIRAFFTISCILSVLPITTTIAVWAWSFAHPIYVEFTLHDEHRRVWVAAGRAGIDNEPEVTSALAQRARDIKELDVLAANMDLLVLRPSRVPARWSRSSALALPAVAAVMAVIVAFPPTVRRVAQRIRAALHLCPICGYNLTGNTSGICPECGTPVPKAPAE